MTSLPIPLPRFEIRKNRNPLARKRYRVVLIAENGEPLSTSQHLTSDHAAMVNIESQKANGIHAAVVRV